MKKLTLLLMLIASINSYSHDDQTRTWLGVFAKKPLSHSKNHLWSEIQYRYDHNTGGMQQLLTRVGALRSFHERHEAGVIFGYIQTGNVREYRPTLQHSYTKNAHSHTYWLRSRLEFRDQENNKTNSVRLRTLNSYRYQLNSKYSSLVWDEPFFNLSSEDWTGRRLFERNRLFLGMRIDESDYRYEIGYLNQYIPRHTKITSEHTLVLYFYF